MKRLYLFVFSLFFVFVSVGRVCAITNVGTNITTGGSVGIGTTSLIGMLHVASTTPFVITSAGDVGIGTTSPSSKLQVAGTVKMTGFQLGASTTSGFVLTADSSGIGTWTAAATGVTGSGTTNYLSKFTSGTALGNSLIYDNGTNIGIGTTNPGQKLSVVGTVESTSGGFKFPDGTTQSTAVTYDRFGGMYLDNPYCPGSGCNSGCYVCNTSNVYTSACSCPSGYSSSQLYGNCSSGRLIYCYK